MHANSPLKYYCIVEQDKASQDYSKHYIPEYVILLELYHLAFQDQLLKLWNISINIQEKLQVFILFFSLRLFLLM